MSNLNLIISIMIFVHFQVAMEFGQKIRIFNSRSMSYKEELCEERIRIITCIKKKRWRFISEILYICLLWRSNCSDLPVSFKKLFLYYVLFQGQSIDFSNIAGFHLSKINREILLIYPVSILGFFFLACCFFVLN